MKKIKVISNKSLPSKLPIWSSLTSFIALDYWNAPEWLWGAIGLFFLAAWVSIIIRLLYQENIDVFEEKEPEKGKTFKEKLIENANE